MAQHVAVISQLSTVCPFSQMDTNIFKLHSSIDYS